MKSTARPRVIAPRSIKASEFKATCLRLMDEVRERGIEIVITKRGQPVAKLGPVEDRPRTAQGYMRGTILHQGDLISPEEDYWVESDSDPLLQG